MEIPVPVLFLEAYVTAVAVLLTTIVVSFFATSAPAAGLAPGRVPRMLFPVGALLALWFAGMAALVQIVDMGAGIVPGGPPWLALAFIGGGLALFALGQFSAPHLFLTKPCCCISNSKNCHVPLLAQDTK